MKAAPLVEKAIVDSGERGKLPQRQKAGKYRQPNYSYKYVPQRF